MPTHRASILIHANVSALGKAGHCTLHRAHDQTIQPISVASVHCYMQYKHPPSFFATSSLAFAQAHCMLVHADSSCRHHLMCRCCVLQTTNSSSPDLKVVAGFNAYECRGSVLMWNNGTTDIPLSLSILNIPYATYNVDFFQLDPVHMPGVRLSSRCLSCWQSHGCMSTATWHIARMQMLVVSVVHRRPSISVAPTHCPADVSE